MSLLTEFPSGYHKPEPLNKSFDMIVREWSRQQFGGDEVVDEIRKALNTGITQSGTYTSNSVAYGYSNFGNGQPTANLYPGQNSYDPGASTALRLENLDNTMTSVLATAEHLKIFRFLHKEPSKQPFYQWNRRESYGSTRGFFGFTEGGLPTGGRGQWSRNGAYIKFLGTKGGVTHPAVLTNILGGMSVDPVAEDQLGRTMDFMQRIERAIMYGDDDIVDNTGTDSNYDGLLKLLTNQRQKNVIDMQGKPLTMDYIANTASKLVSEGKLLSFNDITLFMSPQSIEDFGKMRYQTVLNTTSNLYQGPGTSVDRADLTTSARTNLIAGLSIVGQATSFGVIPFEWSIFTEPVEGNVPVFSKDEGSPSAPARAITAPVVAGYFTVADTNTGIGTCANTSGKSNFDGTKSFLYRVSSVNDVGESLASWTSDTVVTPTSTNEVRLRWNRVQGSGLTQARAYRVYRCEVSSTASTTEANSPAVNATLANGEYRWQYVGYVADPSGKSTTGVGPDGGLQNLPTSTIVQFVDRNGTPELYNNFYGGSTIAPLICRNPADICIAQMSPLLKMPLAPVQTTFEYLLLLYHTLVLKAPERQFIFKNVGKLS